MDTAEKTEEKLPYETVEVPVVEAPNDAPPARPVRPTPVMDVRPPQSVSNRPGPPALDAANDDPVVKALEVEHTLPVEDRSAAGVGTIAPTAAPAAPDANQAKEPDAAAPAAADAAAKPQPSDPEALLADEKTVEAVTPEKVAKMAKLKTPKQPHEPGVGLAIFMAAIVVLLLAGLATYAYFKSNNIAVF